MGAVCCKSDATSDYRGGTQEGGTIGVMFRRIDKEDKGYISIQNLEAMMRDDKTHFQGKDANHIMEKYGTDGKMDFNAFKTWWGSTYTTYNEDALAKIVEEVQDEKEQEEQRLDSIPELPEVPHNSNVAISRS
jgi:hypothetical protein